MNEHEDPTRQQPQALIVSLIFLFAACDLMAPVLLRGAHDRGGEILAVMLGGAFAGQAGLLAVWAVFGPGSLLVRSLMVTSVGMLLGCATVFGALLAGAPPAEFRGIIPSIAIMPLLFLAVQSPVWLLRLAVGGRIVLRGMEETASPANPRQFSIGDLLVTTTLVAICLGLAQLAMPAVGYAGQPGGGPFWSVLLIACGIVAVWSLLGVVPSVWAALVARNPGPAVGVVGLLAVLLTFLASVTLRALSGGPLGGTLFLMLFLFQFGTMGVLLSALLPVRYGGYVYRKSPRQPDDRLP